MSFPQWVSIPTTRGCGVRTPGGVYAESGVGPYGSPLETFLLDPPMPLPDGLDLANKAQLWEDPHSDPSNPIVHLLIWVGAEHYPYVADYIEETRRYGASRKLSPLLDFSQLGPQSRLYLAHPKTLNTTWRDHAPPVTCLKEVEGHVADATHPPAGPCLFKTYDLIPRDAALDPHDPLHIDGRPYYYRTIGSTDYYFSPTGEDASGLVPGIFAALPITGFALIQRADGTVNEQAEKKLRQAHLPSYHTAE